jgi:hypothetical protein
MEGGFYPVPVPSYDLLPGPAVNDPTQIIMPMTEIPYVTGNSGVLDAVRSLVGTGGVRSSELAKEAPPATDQMPAEQTEDQPKSVDTSSSRRVRPPVSADQLRTVIRKAVQEFPTSACDSVAAVARAFGIDDLDGNDANAQLDYMKRNWEEVESMEAQSLANHAGLVVAGKQGDYLADAKGMVRTDEDGNRIRAGGHVAVVVPSRLNDGRFPIVASGAGTLVRDAKTGRITLVKSSASSTSGRSVKEIWKEESLPRVRYYTPAQVEGR